MVTICIGPVCVPLHLLLPFIVGILHRRGWFRWFKQEWVTLRFWQSWWAGSPQKAAEVKAKPDVAKADDAVNDAMQSSKSSTGSAPTGHSTNTGGQVSQTQDGKHETAKDHTQGHGLQSGLNRPAGLQQRTVGQYSQQQQRPPSADW